MTQVVVGRGSIDRQLLPAEVRAVAGEALRALPLDGRRVLVIIPDGTRTMPMPLMYDVLDETLGGRVASLDFLVAQGTHRPMSDAELATLVGRPVRDGRAGSRRIFNHRWDDPATFTTLGAIAANEVATLTAGLLRQEVPVALNRLVLDYDHLIVCGPVFPHEVVGFSGGTKYLVPGIAGPDIVNLTHWLGALMTSSAVIGMADTPIRALIDRAAGMLSRPISCVALVVTHERILGLFAGAPRDAWRAAAELSARAHIVWVDRPFSRVLSVMPRMYEDLWTAAKGVYKVEPVVADGGEVIIYAPHVTEASHSHGALLDEIGYHCRDYFVAQWDRFGTLPGSVLAHATHVAGRGTYDAVTGVERLRISVTLATGIPRERCARLNLGYLDPTAVRVEDWQARRDDGVLVVDPAGEMLYRLRG